ncbi:MAG: DUF2207 domain-containing protein, partial [Hyphomonadaceae bacterium]
MRAFRALSSLLFAGVFAALFAMAASAQERIDRFDVAIEVQKDGDIVVTELLAITSEGQQIRRGIFRDLPRYFASEGAKLPYGYDILSAKRDGRREPYKTETEDNAYRIRIGDADVFLESGAHAYEIRYRVRNQVRYFDNYDEVYWNVTGNYWVFPILAVRVSVVLPPGARITATKGYTGDQGAAGADYTHTGSGSHHVFETTRRLEAGEGLTVAIGFDKGLIDPPSGIDQNWLWWQRNGALAILLASLGGLAWFYLRSFDRVGRDPIKGPVFPLYEPPTGFSPAAAHHVYYRGLRGHTALIATLMNLAVKGRMRIDTSKKSVTILERIYEGDDAAGLASEDVTLERSLLTSRRVLDGKYDSILTGAYDSFKATLSRKYGADYFKWNIGYTVAGLALTAGGVVFAASQASMWTTWHTLALLA